MKRIACCVFPLLVLCSSCTIDSGAELVKSTGDPCIVTFTASSGSMSGELLAVDDTAVYLHKGNALYRIPWPELRKIRIQGYSNAETKTLLNGLPGIVAVGFGLSLMKSVEHDSRDNFWPVLLVAAGALNITAAMTNNPTASFRPPLRAGDMERLRLFARYPQGLDGAQWKTLLDWHGQSTFRTAILDGK
jgi:hypothetical protein